MKKVGIVLAFALLLAVPAFLIWKNRQGPPPESTGQITRDIDKPTDQRPKGPIIEDPVREQPVFVNANAPRPAGVNLLRLPQAQRVRTTAPPLETGDLDVLTDDKGDTFAVASAAPEAPLDIVYGFSGEIVAIEALLVRLPELTPAGTGAGRVEILVSNLSPHAGFHLVRTDPLVPTGSAQIFPFPSIGARWVLLRFHSAGAAPRVAIAEVGLIGHVGPPFSHYAFHESPARAIDVLNRLKELSGVNLTLGPDEDDLVRDAQDGKLDRWTFAEAALLASGVPARDRCKPYLDQIAALEVEAKKATEGSKDPWDKGNKLLRWLHARPLEKGYVSGQTDLSTLLDQQVFNCVSSAVAFNILAARLGLDARAVEVPDHAFSIVYDDTKHADVETTLPEGFNPVRDAIEALQKQTGFIYIPDSHRDQRREVRDIGLTAIIYYNHAVQLTQEQRWHEALAYYFRALSLDSELLSAVKNTLAVLALWSLDLAANEQYADAVQVLDVGLALAPKDARLRHNRVAIWTYWAMTLVAAGKDDEALAVLRKAADAVPDGHFAEMQAWIFIRKAELLVRSRSWEESLQLIETALPKVGPPAQKELRQYRVGLRLRWAYAEIAVSHYARALDILAAGLGQDPEDGRLAVYLAFAVQEYVWAVHQKEGEPRAREELAVLVKRFAEVRGVQGVAAGYVWFVIKDLVAAGKYDEALAFIDRSGDLLLDHQVRNYLVLLVHDFWADSYARKNEYVRAMECYGRARKNSPDDKETLFHIQHRLRCYGRAREEAGAWEDAIALYEKYRKDLLTEQEANDRLLYLAILWTRKVYEQEGASRADEISRQLMSRFPNIPELKRGLNQQALVELIHELTKKGRYEQALAVIERAGRLLEEKDKSRKLYFTLLRELSLTMAADYGKQPVSLSQWRKQGPPDVGVWKLVENGTAVLQTENSGQTFYVSPDEFRNTTVRGRFKVDADAGDDDYIGFVFGYQAPLGNVPDGQVPCDMFLLAWKSIEQEGAKEGLTLVRIRGAIKFEDTIESAWWTLAGNNGIKVLATEHGDGKGWRHGKEYEFELHYHADCIRIVIDGKTIFDVANTSGDNPAGRFGFYNYSQAGTYYSGFTLQSAPPPLAALNVPELEATLRQALTDAEGAVRTAAADILGNLRVTTAVPDLIQRVADDVWIKSPYSNTELNDPIAGGKAAALTALRKLAPDQVTAALVQALKSKTNAVAVWASTELATQKEPAAQQALLEALTSSDGHIRRAAADALGQRGDKEAAPALVRRIADDLWLATPGGFFTYHDEPYDGFKGLGSKDHALAALQKMAPEQVAPALIEALKAQNSKVKAWAAVNLGAHKGPGVQEALAKALEDPDGYVRRSAADSLGQLGDKAAVGPLSMRLADEVWVSIPQGFFTYSDEPYDGYKGLGSKDHALAALKKVSQEQVASALIKALKAKDARVRAWAAVNLGANSGHGALEALVAALEDADGYVRRGAADSLGQLGDKAALPALVKRVADDVWMPTPGSSFNYRDEPYDGFRGLGSKDHALAALKKLDPTQAKVALEEAAKSKNDRVKAWAGAELKKLK